MTISLTSPVSGGAQTGFTSPTYTVTADASPTANSRQWAVTAVGGSGNTARLHANGDPFTATYFRVASYKSLGPLNAVGAPSRVPRNVDKWVFRKGVIPHTSLAAQPAIVTVTIDRPAGSEANNPIDLRALMSLAIGVLTQQSAGNGDTVVSGIL
jgi:hypothetical protein